MISIMIFLYVVCGIFWAIWEIHAYLTFDKEMIDMLNKLPNRARMHVITISATMSGIMTILAWPIAIPVSMYKLYKMR